MRTSTTQLVLLGSGAREHALVIKPRQDGATVHVLPGNAPNLTATSPDNAAQAALRALNTPRLRERLRQEML